MWGRNPHREERGVGVDGGVTPVSGALALRLAQLLASRLSHDLSGPLGGLGAALGEADAEPAALALAHEATLVLRQRLALFRAAWGGAPAPVGREVLRDLAGGLPNAGRLRVELEALADAPPFAPAAAPVVVNAMLLAAESLAGGGLLAVAGNPAGTVVLTIAGPRAAWPAGLGAMLASPAAAWQALAAPDGRPGLRVLPAAATALLAQAAGVRAALLLAGRAEAVPPLLLDFAAGTPV